LSGWECLNLLNRRDLLQRVALSALTIPASGLIQPHSANAASDASEAAKLNALFDKFAEEDLRRNPETATSFGLDNGARAGLKSRLSDYSLAATQKERLACKHRLAELKTIDRTKLSGIDAANYDTIWFVTSVEDEANSTLDYGGGGATSPYILHQLGGTYQFMPDFLDTQHSIETKDDADAYLARMAGFATAMDQELEQLRHDAASGVVPPDFVIDKTLIQMQAFLDTPIDQAVLVTSIARRAREKGLEAQYGDRAATLYTDKIIPALARQIAYLKELRLSAVHNAGIGSRPKGADFYRIALKQYTTSTLSPDEIHKIGLDLVARYTAEIDARLRAQGITQGTVGQRLAALAVDPHYFYADTDEAKDQLVADLNTKVGVVQAKLPEYFGTVPKAKVEIRRVPKQTEAGAPEGYYQPGSLDGARPGGYYINLRDVTELPKWRLPTLTFHESIPGHHLQITLSNEVKDMPLIRQMTWFSGYGEGWAHYSEQLAVEMGLYDQDPLGYVGQLHGALWRAVRLVVDTGMHARGWSRERATDYYTGAMGDKESAALTEIERYCVWPGQACSYMIGKVTWLRLRDQAKAALGHKFDIRKFHDAGLLNGAVPLAVLETVIGDYIAVSKA
jgi:uncharacterized protein (DUF885 family)